MLTNCRQSSLHASAKNAISPTCGQLILDALGKCDFTHTCMWPTNSDTTRTMTMRSTNLETVREPGEERSRVTPLVKSHFPERTSFCVTYNNQLDVLISQIYFGRKFYMFRTVPLSIIRVLHYTHSNGVCQLASRIRMFHPDPSRKLSANL
jgi:hypothetical protein